MHAPVQQQKPNIEFISLMAFMMSLVALSIDAIMPAMTMIESSLNLTPSQDIQLVISLVLLGQGIGQLVFGPLSDTFGRKPLIYAGYAVFLAATLVCMWAPTYESLLIARFIQGFGLAAPRVLTMAIIRDKYAGPLMAQVMSFIMVFFILVPMIAPLIGQGILLVADWHTIFAVMLILGIISLIWFAIRQPETLADENRKALKPSVLWNTCKEVFTTPVSMAYTLAAGILSGAFISYLASAQQVFGGTYELGEYFALYFSGLALVYGLASFFNGKLVVRKGMQFMVFRAFYVLVASSVIFMATVIWQDYAPPLSWVTFYFVVSFASVGVLFGNLNSLAMEPLGHLAGFGAAVVGAVSTLTAVSIALFIGSLFDGTIWPLTLGFCGCSIVSAVVVFAIERFRTSEETSQS
ncbi:multidrug effflux MFS transporter [Psychrobium sp. MM17-31]|uniref:multidrug effflux MFS transporter n=1 Tax=Psychrobium sp. MM17-31 TaxID=2917758 RepID=UPI001EF64CED|nr:multidrug effflux MFS transporter [Psychrobium sp. MM17-31]MCG7532529.1 multidrug effflux MFS transporter [Psychrobium sp. MM17-31]